jgi:hypothetical protein
LTINPSGRIILTTTSSPGFQPEPVIMMGFLIRAGDRTVFSGVSVMLVDDPDSPAVAPAEMVKAKTKPMKAKISNLVFIIIFIPPLLWDLI